MRNKILNLVSKIYGLKNKIAFFPSIIAIAGLIFAYIMMYLENRGISKYILDFLPELVINNTETARTILTTFIASLISIMVFSFSMVMILLNQASSNFSPRLLPSLISNRRHQIVLGVYLFTIVYCIFILVLIEPTGNKKYQLPGFSVLLSIFFMLNSLAAFIYFVHSISQEIQINNILLKIFSSAKNKLEKLIKKDKEFENTVPNSENWTTYNAKYAGYFSVISIDTLLSIADKNNTKIEIISNKGDYCSEGNVLFKVEKNIDEEIIDKIYKNFNFSKNELIEDNYLLAFKQITEVAVKSMSPGINDPGTAINAIDYLSQLFLLRSQKKDVNIVCKENKVLLILNSIKFNDLLYNTMAPLRTYCSHDIIIVRKLLKLLTDLTHKTILENYKKAIKFEIKLLLKDAEREIANPEDFKKLKGISSIFNEI